MKKKIIIIATVLLIAVTAIALVSCSKPSATPRNTYSITQLDLSQPNTAGAEYSDLYAQYVVDDASDYMAHPDSVLVDRGGTETILTMYPEGHGRGAVLTKESSDGGKTWGARRNDTPASWKESKETPTIYRLINEKDDENADKKVTRDWLVMISAVPSWGKGHGDGFNASISKDDGRTWSEFKNYWGYKTDGYVNAIVAMASLTRLKGDNGEFIDAWMGLYHDYDFYNYKTILTFDNEGNMVWSKPEKYFAKYRDIEKKSNMCEVEVVRSENGKGDELMLIGRSNSKKMASILSYSTDEGKTWSEPREVAASLNGERHKADYLPDGRLVITFRCIQSDPTIYAQISDKFKKENWYSEGWIAWVGTYQDLKGMYNGTANSEGQYRVKLAHTYLDGQTFPQLSANADTGYCGNVVMSDGTFVTSSYGQFGKKNAKGEYITYIISKRIDFTKVDKLIANMQG